MDESSKNKASLFARAGTKLVLILLTIIVIVAVMVTVANVEHEGRVVRGQMGGALSEGKAATYSVAEHFYEKNEFPKDLVQAGFVHQPSKLVRQILLDQKSGVVTLVLAFAPYEGRTIMFRPNVKADKSIAWSCTTKDFPVEVLPSQCRFAE